MEQKAGIIDRVVRTLKLKPNRDVKAPHTAKTTAKVATKPKSGNKATKKVIKAKKK
jgi:hypothetical protein